MARRSNDQFILGQERVRVTNSSGPVCREFSAVGVKRVYEIVGDSLHGTTEVWEPMRCSTNAIAAPGLTTIVLMRTHVAFTQSQMKLRRRHTETPSFRDRIKILRKGDTLASAIL